MSDFDLRKFLAEQKAVKVETVKEEEAVQEEAIEEVETQEEAVEETYHEGEDTMEEGDVTESVLAGIAALVGGTVGLGKLLDYLKSKGFELTDPSGKSVLDTTIRGLKKEEETHEGEEMEEEVNEEEIKENTFKSSIKDILNS